MSTETTRTEQVKGLNETAKLAVQLKTIAESLDLLHLLTRDSNKEKHQNKLTILEEFIKSTGRFPELASLVQDSSAVRA
jgi:hypothetical protein